MTSPAVQYPLAASILAKLSAGTALISALGGTAIFYAQAKDHQALPYVVYSFASGSLENRTPRITTNQLMYVRAYAATAAQAGSIDALCASLLHQASLTVTGWLQPFQVQREQEIMQPDPPDAAGQITWAAGAFYRVRINQS